MSSQEQTKLMREAVIRVSFFPAASGGLISPSATQDRWELRVPDEGLPPLPSVFSPLRLREGADAIARAVELAPVKGAGALAWVGSLSRAEAAVVLEPGLPLGPARLAWLAAANALADAIAALAPPELPVRWLWPATLTVNGGRVGRVRLVQPEGIGPDDVPPWLVAGFEVRLLWPEGTVTGQNPDETALAEEGFEELTAAGLTEGWARHLMANLDEWEARGPRRVTDKFLARLADGEGARRGIEPHTGALVLERDGAREVIPLP